MGTLYDKDRNLVHRNLDALREGIIDLMVSNSDFLDAILLGTSENYRVLKRFDLMRDRVDEILGDDAKQPRALSAQLKKELFEKDPTCALCKQRIQHIDDFPADPIAPYWRGGKTIPGNPRLMHRYCNLARPKAD